MPKIAALSFLLLLILAPFARAQDDSAYQPFSPDQLDNLLASVALYPDPLLAQILPAATFPDQIDEAARFVRGGASPDQIDTQPWDVSVRALAHYPNVLYMMADNLDWVTALGQAYVNQSEDVMASIQRLRQQAKDAGNLQSTPQQDVQVDDGNLEIWPEQGDDMYLPVYDAGLVYFGSGGVYGGTVITFNGPLPIGVYLNRNIDWRRKRIYYHGWSERNGWVALARPYVHLNNVYVNKNMNDVTVDRSVTARPVNYGNLARFGSAHQSVAYRAPAPAASAGNKIAERNQSVSPALVDEYRGRAPQESAGGAAVAARAAGNAAFGQNRGSFGAQKSSERGQSSRAQAAKSASAHSGGGAGSHAGGGGGAHASGGGGGGGSHGGGGGGKH